MPQVIRVDEMKCLAGWDKVEELVRQKMIEWGPKLEHWTMIIAPSPVKAPLE